MARIMSPESLAMARELQRRLKDEGVGSLILLERAGEDSIERMAIMHQGHEALQAVYNSLTEAATTHTEMADPQTVN